MNSRYISSEVNPEKFQQLLEQMSTEKPTCPWNFDAAETLAKPPERRGWQTSYVKAQADYREPEDE
ncbi:MAG: hypothetical protein U7123_08470 [Potamolinea sp.]